MSNRSDKKLRHREDVKPMPSFKERSQRGVQGESVCPNPYCRTFSRTLLPNKLGCEHCYEIPKAHVDMLKERLASLSKGEAEPIPSDEVHLDEHVHGPDCNH